MMFQAYAGLGFHTALLTPFLTALHKKRQDSPIIQGGQRVQLPSYSHEHSPTDKTNAGLSSSPALTCDTVVLVGWSYGGLQALRTVLAHHVTAPSSLSPSPYVALVLIATSPCFSQQRGWPGISRRQQDAFLKSVAKARTCLSSPSRDASHFATAKDRVHEEEKDAVDAFMTSYTGDVTYPHTTAALRHTVRTHLEVPSATQMHDLFHTDMREAVETLTLPVCLFHGEKDAIVPVSVACALSALLPQAQVHRLKGAGHAPFLTHKEKMIEALVPFLHRHGL